MQLNESQKNLLFMGITSFFGICTYALFFRAVFFSPEFFQIWILPTLSFMIFSSIFLLYAMVSNIKKHYFLMIVLVSLSPILFLFFTQVSIGQIVLVWIMCCGVALGLYQVSHGIHLETQERIRVRPKKVLSSYITFFILIHICILTTFFYIARDVNTKMKSETFEIPQALLDTQLQALQPAINTFFPEFQIHQSLGEFFQKNTEEAFNEGFTVNGVSYQDLSEETKKRVEQQRANLIEKSINQQMTKFNNRFGTNFEKSDTISQIVFEVLNSQIHSFFERENTFGNIAIVVVFFFSLTSLIPILSPLILIGVYIVRYGAKAFGVILIEERLVEKEDLVF